MPVVLVTKEELTAHLKELLAPMQKALNEISQNQILSLEEVMRLTGYKKNTIYAKTSKNTMPHYKRGNKLFFKRGEIIAWIEESRNKAKN